jgi:hypothetical protein
MIFGMPESDFLVINMLFFVIVIAIAKIVNAHFFKRK